MIPSRNGGGREKSWNGVLTYIEGVPSGEVQYEIPVGKTWRMAYFPWMKVLMLKPRVGLILMMSSSLSFLTMVVFPALSSPLKAFSQESKKYMFELAGIIVSFPFPSVCFF